MDVAGVELVDTGAADALSLGGIDLSFVLVDSALVGAVVVGLDTTSTCFARGVEAL